GTGEGLRVRQFRGDGDAAREIAAVAGERIDVLRGRREIIEPRMAAASGGGEVRPIKVSPDDTSAAGVRIAKLAAEPEEAGIVRFVRDGAGRRQRRGAVLHMRPTDGPKGVRSEVHEVRPAAAVDVDIDKAGSEILATEIDD